MEDGGRGVGGRHAPRSDLVIMDRLERNLNEISPLKFEFFPRRHTAAHERLPKSMIMGNCEV